jgi:hypothetical protein
MNPTDTMFNEKKKKFNTDYKEKHSNLASYFREVKLNNLLFKDSDKSDKIQIGVTSGEKYKPDGTHRMTSKGLVTSYL